MNFFRKAAPVEPDPAPAADAVMAYAESTLDRAIKKSTGWTIDLRTLDGFRWVRALLIAAYQDGARSR